MPIEPSRCLQLVSDVNVEFRRVVGGVELPCTIQDECGFDRLQQFFVSLGRQGDHGVWNDRLQDGVVRISIEDFAHGSMDLACVSGFIQAVDDDVDVGNGEAETRVTAQSIHHVDGSTTEFARGQHVRGERGEDDVGCKNDHLQHRRSGALGVEQDEVVIGIEG